MADAARSLFFDLSWDIETKKLNDANKMADNLKTSASEMFDDVDNASKAISTSGSTISKQFKTAGTSVDTAGDKIADTDKKTSKLVGTTGEVGDTFDDVAKDAKKATTTIEKQNKKVGKTAEDASKNVSKIGDEAEKATGKTKKLGGAMEGVGKAAKGIAVAGGAAVLAVGAAVIKAGMDYQEHFKIIAAGSGASGEQLDGLMSSFEKVGKNATADLGDVASAIANVNTYLGYEGQALEDYSDKTLKLGQVTGGSIDTIVNSTAKMANQWSLTEGESLAALDKLLVASQNTNVPVEQLTGSVMKFGPALRELGYDLDASIAMVGQWDRAGLDGNKMLVSMKKATAGLAASGVKDLNKGMQDVINSIEAATTSEKANAIAMEHFGLEGIAMAEAIRSGAFEVDELVGSLKNSEGAIEDTARLTETFGEKMNRFKNNVTLALAPIGGQMLDVFSDVLDKITPMLSTIAENAAVVFEKIGPFIATALEQVLPVVDILFELLGEAFGLFEEIDLSGVFKGIMDGVKKILPVVTSVLSSIFKILAPIMSTVFELVDILLPVVIDVISQVGDVVSTLLDSLAPLIELFVSIAQVVLPPVIEIVGVLAGILTDVLGVAFDVIGNYVKMVMGVFEGLIKFITGVFTGNWSKAWEGVKDIFSSIVSGLGNIFKAPINFIIRGINKFLSGLNKIKIPDWVPLVGGKGFSISLIPELAKGTNFFEGGPAVVGERGPELVTLPTGTGVMPNDKTERLFNKVSGSSERGGDTYYIDNNVEIEVNAEGADEAALDRLRGELKIEIPRALEKAFKKMYLKNKPQPA